MHVPYETARNANAQVLRFDQVSHIGRQQVVHCVIVRVDRDTLAPHRFRDDRSIRIACQPGPHSDPGAVQGRERSSLSGRRALEFQCVR